MLVHLLVHMAAPPKGNVFMRQFGTTERAFTVPSGQCQQHHQVKRVLSLQPGLCAVQCQPTAVPQVKIQRLTLY